MRMDEAEDEDEDSHNLPLVEPVPMRLLVVSRAPRGA